MPSTCRCGDPIAASRIDLATGIRGQIPGEKYQALGCTAAHQRAWNIDQHNYLRNLNHLDIATDMDFWLLIGLFRSDAMEDS